MRQAVLTIIGLYNWDSSLFDGMHLPEAIPKEEFIDELLSMAANQNVLYPDFDLMKRLITTWSGRRLSSWERMAAALNAEYNPIHNFDRHEDYTDTRNLTGGYTDKVEGTDSQDVAAYDASTLQPRSKSSVDNTLTRSYNDGGNVRHEGHLYGNIGVTTSQQMIEAELGLRKSDLMEIIIGEFIGRFCLDVYN